MIMIEMKFPNGVLQLMKDENDSNVIGRGSKYTVYYDNRSDMGQLKKGTIIFNRPLTRDGMEEACVKFTSLLMEAMNYDIELSDFKEVQ